MLTRATLKHIKSLQQKKFRREHGCFVVEGGKSVAEVLASDFVVLQLLCTEAFLPQICDAALARGVEPLTLGEAALTEISTLENNHSALAVVQIPAPKPIHRTDGEWLLALDGIRDPGNLGTIIRTADWFGIRQIFCSEDCAELFNAKVLAASMGSFTRVHLAYGDLAAFLSAQRARDAQVPVLGMDLDGDNVHRLQFATGGGVIVVGSESHGLSADVQQQLSARITIPAFGQAESLNAAIATAIVLDNLRR